MTETRRQTLIGALIGACFPLAALLLSAPAGADPGGGMLAALQRAHASQPLLYLLYLVPVALALFGRALGARQDSLLAQRAELGRRVTDAAESLLHAREETRRAREQAAHLAGHDPLTGVRNRRSIGDEAARAVKAARRYARPLGVLYVDLDRLKSVNEAYGEGAGDRYLAIVAAALSRALRETDTVGRWGDDEFLVLLPETGSDGAAIVAERLLAMVSGSPALLGEHQVRPSVSIGIALYPEHGDAPEKLLERAAAAMEQARMRGGGSFSVFGQASRSSM
jgi:diguanylate cyclase (GGDEF)-like protein